MFVIKYLLISVSLILLSELLIAGQKGVKSRVICNGLSLFDESIEYFRVVLEIYLIVDVI